MSLDKLLAEIERIGQVANRWNAEGQIADIEREIVLDKLKHIYEEVMFLDRVRIADDSASVPEVPQASPEAVTAEKDIAAQDGESNVSEISEPELSVPTSSETLVTAEPVQASDAERQTEDTPQDAEPAVLAEGEQAVGDSDAAVASDPESDSDSASNINSEAITEGAVEEVVVEESMHVSVTVQEQSVEQKLFSDEPLVRPRVDKRVILSLYGDDTTTHHSSSAASTHTSYQAGTSQSVQPQAEDVQPTDPAIQSPQPNMQTAAGASASVGYNTESVPHKKVLGETLSRPATAVNEMIGKQTVHADVASRLRSRGITDLKHGIGLNDRFLLIRDLFGGQADEYERVIGELERFTAFDEAMIYIQENFDWNPDCDGATFLVELLERKLEQ